MIRFNALSVALLMIWLMSLSGHGKQSIEKTLQNYLLHECRLYTYEVNGDSLQLIEKALKKNGPVDSSGIKRYALTDWSIYWKFINKDSEGNVKVIIDSKIEIKLPRLGNQSNLNLEELYKWNKINAAIISHELVHIQNGIDTEKKMKEFLYGSAQRAESIVQPELVRILRVGQRKDLEYDINTKHGSFQGVNFDSNFN